MQKDLGKDCWPLMVSRASPRKMAMPAFKTCGHRGNKSRHQSETLQPPPQGSRASQWSKRDLRVRTEQPGAWEPRAEKEPKAEGLPEGKETGRYYELRTN